MKKSILLFPVEQPIGTFYVGKIQTEDLLNIHYLRRRSTDELGIQRDLNDGRAIKISEYLNDPDATFPTSIIVSFQSEDVKFSKIKNADFDVYKLEFDDEKKRLAEIIDGQHRIEGMLRNKITIKELPIVVLFDLTREEMAVIFSVINSNQRPVPKSYIYDLFDLYSGRSPLKTCHSIAKALNSDINSPFYMRMKMLGRKANENESISQGSFVFFLCSLISKDPDYDERAIKNDVDLEMGDNPPILRKWFINDKDEIIYKILFNYFDAVKEIFPDEWANSKESILTKTTGIGGLFKAFSYAYELGIKEKELTKEFFVRLFKSTSIFFAANNIVLRSVSFGSGEAAQKRLSKRFIESWTSEVAKYE